LVKSVIDDITTYSPSAAYQVKTNGMYTNTRKYYSFNGAVVAMRENGVVTWLQQDQVNSTTITADANGNLLTETRYSAFGEIRYTNGITVTDKLYTGQQQETEIGLDYYIARFYDPVIGYFIQPDTLIPQASASASYDRYAYVNGNPVNFNDPSGHCPLCVSAAIGAGIGAVVGGVGYGIYIAVTGNEFNWGQFALAAGGGLAAGALIGTGVGWAAGVSQATATTAAVTGAGTATTTATTGVEGDRWGSNR